MRAKVARSLPPARELAQRFLGPALSPLGFRPCGGGFLAFDRVHDGHYQCVEVMVRGAERLDGSVFRVRMGSINPAAFVMGLADMPKTQTGGWHLVRMPGMDPPPQADSWWRVGTRRRSDGDLETVGRALSEVVSVLAPRFFRMVDRLGLPDGFEPGDCLADAPCLECLNDDEEGAENGAASDVGGDEGGGFSDA